MPSSLWRAQKLNQVMLPWIYVFFNASNQEKHLSEALAFRLDAIVMEGIEAQGLTTGSQCEKF